MTENIDDVASIGIVKTNYFKFAEPPNEVILSSG